MAKGRSRLTEYGRKIMVIYKSTCPECDQGVDTLYLYPPTAFCREGHFWLIETKED